MDDLGEARQRGTAEAHRLICHPGEFVLRGVQQPTGGGVGHRVDEDEVAEPVEQVDCEPARIVTGLDDAVDCAVHPCRVTRGQGVDHVVEQRTVRDAEQGYRSRVRDAFGTGTGQQLIEDRQRVTRRSSAGADYKREYRGLDGDLFGHADGLEMCPHDPWWDEPERVVMRARPDRGQHLVRLCGGEHEHQEPRRLLDQLEQGVEALRGHHVRFVDDVDLVAVSDGSEEGTLTQFSRVVHAAVAGRVDLDDVDRTRPVRREFDARIADAAGVRRRALGAVQRPGEDARARRLATASGPAEQVGVVDAAVGQGVAKRLGDMLLADDLGERRRAVLAIERQVSRHAMTVVSTSDAGRIASSFRDLSALRGVKTPRSGDSSSVRATVHKPIRCPHALRAACARRSARRLWPHGPKSARLADPALRPDRAPARSGPP